MEQERKIKLINYLFPTQEVRSFMCNDLFLELEEIIPINICIGSKNLVKKVRLENLNKVKQIIVNFLCKNEMYLKNIEELFKKSNINSIVDDVVIGYVFFIVCKSGKYASVDIFKDMRSICYSPISPIDLM